MYKCINGKKMATSYLCVSGTIISAPEFTSIFICSFAYLRFIQSSTQFMCASLFWSNDLPYSDNAEIEINSSYPLRTRCNRYPILNVFKLVWALFISALWNRLKAVHTINLVSLSVYRVYEMRACYVWICRPIKLQVNPLKYDNGYINKAK